MNMLDKNKRCGLTAKNRHGRVSNEVKMRIIDRQSKEIESLKEKISQLEIAASEKDELLSSVDDLLEDLRESVDVIQSKSDEYEELVDDLRDMKKIIDEEVFHRNWWIIKHLLR